MRITFSVSKKVLKKHQAEFAVELESTVPEAVALLDPQRGYLVLDLTPDADPIEVTKKARSLAEKYGMKLVRIPNVPLPGDAARNTNGFATQDVPKPPQRMVKMSRYVISLIAVALISSALMLYLATTFLSGGSTWFDDTLGTGEQQGEDYAAKIALVDFLFENYSLYETDGKLLLDEMLRAYAKATKDEYAAYYTEEEFQMLLSEMEGSSVGVGVSVTWDPDTQSIYVIRVMAGSPAQSAGLLAGDRIVAIGTAAQNERVSEIGYSAAMQKLLGDEGTAAQFVVLRNGAEIEFSIIRASFTATTVEGRQSATDPTVAIIAISGFDANTPAQLKNEMGRLINIGCRRFVYDVRNNPGGELKSIRAVLSYFANEDDVLLSIVTKQGDTTYYKAEAITYTGEYAACSVEKEEIGMYRGYPAVVITNGNTASAAELFTAAMRDFGLADTVGEKTYGKGVLQSIFDLSDLGQTMNMDISGGVKLTVGYYAPPCGENYDGVGIVPSIPVALSEEAQSKNLYLLRENEDDQLLAAINNVKTK